MSGSGGKLDVQVMAGPVVLADHDLTFNFNLKFKAPSSWSPAMTMRSSCVARKSATMTDHQADT